MTAVGDDTLGEGDGAVPGNALGGQTAVVTGGAGGVGAAIVTALAARGCRVVVADVLHDVDARVSRLGPHGRLHPVHCDVSRPEQVLATVDEALEVGGGRIDILVNNAGVVRLTDPLDDWEKSQDDYDAIMDVNFKGAFLFGRAVLPVMSTMGSGNVVNLSTEHVHTCGWPRRVDHRDAAHCPWEDTDRPPGALGLEDVYDASKWALHGLTQAWAKRLHGRGVRVNNLCLGAADSPMLRGFYGYSDTPPPDDLRAAWQDPRAVARVLVELVLEGPAGRSGDNVGIWWGHPATLPPPDPVLDVRTQTAPAAPGPTPGRGVATD